MPYTKDGVIPDLIVNPHAIPSRMTIGQFMECLGAKAAAVGLSNRVDGTPFEPLDTVALKKALAEAGFDASCNEVMYNSEGKQLEADVFIGPTYYQRLKQMVEDKINYRGRTGARDNVTNQPVGGRARGGGLRMGEMENSCVLAHGMMGMVTESTTARSDGRSYSWQDGDGAPAVFNESENYFRPGAATDEDKRFRRRAIPRAFSAFGHELSVLGVDMKLLDEPREAPMSEFVQSSCGRPDPFAR
jgi:DNA-directed RNA polymerase II subunit RPB2